ncbi:unnamed protein product [Arctogadus glacialis]
MQPCPSHGLTEMVHSLAEFTVKQFYPELEGQYEQWFREVVQRTARLVAHWQVYGFVHGVLNTDNLSILGLTIDFGPYAFMDRFSPRHVSNHSDKDGRYSYANQPKACRFNL